MRDIARSADRRGMPIEEALASRFRGMARERTKKRTRIASITHDDTSAVGVIEILPDQASGFDMRAGPLAALAGTIPGDALVRVRLNGELLTVDKSRLELDDNVLTLVLEAPHVAVAGMAFAPLTDALPVVEPMTFARDGNTAEIEPPRRGRPRKG